MKRKNLIHWLNSSLIASSSVIFAAESSLTLSQKAKDLEVGQSGFYLDRGKWLAIQPDKNKSAGIEFPVQFADGNYNVVLRAVGEEDGKASYRMSVNGNVVGEFTCPLSKQSFEEGANFSSLWKNIKVNGGDVIKIEASVASEDGKEYSRARWLSLDFEPADDATLAANKKLTSATPTTKVQGPDLVMPRQENGNAKIEVSGELKQWHKVSLTLNGPFAAEMDRSPNPFTDYNFTVTFTHESGSPSYQIPGFFAADGDAANSSADAGTQWRALLSPDKIGTWTYTTSFTQGKNAALGEEATALAPFDGLKGSFTIAASDKMGIDLRSKGRLKYVGEHYLQFDGSKQYFIKAGADAPETFLAYVDIDNTIAGKKKVPLKTWQAHLKDWKSGDPTWKDGKGKAIIGAINYLSAKGVNAFSFLTYNAGGDGDNIWPFVHRDQKLNYDCSKLDQWTIIFDHAQQLGLYLHFKTQENENDDARGPGAAQSLDKGNLGPERKLYYRELVARFGHELALNWNFGEETTQSTEQQNAAIDYVEKIDPYQHLRVIHSYPNEQEKIYNPLLGSKSKLTGASLQNGWNKAHQRTLEWVTKSAEANKPWVVANDEQGSAGEGIPPDPGYEGFSGKAGKGKDTYDLHDVRKFTLWGTLMAGGQGVEYYFGYQLAQNDLICEDYRSRDQSWDFARIAIEFFQKNPMPLQDMRNANALIGNDKNDNSKYCFAKTGEVYLVYLPQGGSSELNLSDITGDFSVHWFDPRQGGKPTQGSITSVKGGKNESIGTAPNSPTDDWLVIIRKK